MYDLVSSLVSAAVHPTDAVCRVYRELRYCDCFVAERSFRQLLGECVAANAAELSCITSKQSPVSLLDKRVKMHLFWPQPETRFPMRTHLRLAALSALFISSLTQAADLIPIEVHRDANCGCCKKWVSHLEANGFKVEDHVEADMSQFKQQHGIPPRLASCHTGLINGKFVEGHVPADQVLALSKRDDLLGVAAPGMPMGSPGMEMDGMSDAYQVIGLKKDGTDVVVADYPAH